MGGMMGGQGLSQLVNRTDVQADLKVTADQKKKLEEAQAKAREEMQALRGQGDPQAMREAMEKMRASQDAKLKEILTPEQHKRLKEISIQLQGNRAILDADVQKELGFTADQKSRVQRLQERQMDEMRNLMEDMRGGGGGGDRTAMQQQMQKFNENFNTELGKILTPEQATKLKEMGGAPFKATDQPRRGGGGG